jgi:hypothetical protein
VVAAAAGGDHGEYGAEDPLNPQNSDPVAARGEKHEKSRGVSMHGTPGDTSGPAAAATLPLPGGSAAASLPHRPGVDEATIQAAIDSLTRALATAADDAIPGLVDERRALREELRELREGDAGWGGWTTRRG